jgi:hypothetical protein
MERFPFDAFEAFMQEHQRCDVLDAAGSSCILRESPQRRHQRPLWVPGILMPPFPGILIGR